MKQKIPPRDAVKKGPSLEERLVQIMDGAREAVGVDRLHLWALAPEGGRLLYVAGSGLSKDDKRSLVERPEMRLAKVGPIAKALRGETGLLVNGSDALLPRLRPAFRAVRSGSHFVAPLLVCGRPLGLLVADNKYSGTGLTAERLRLLPNFASCLATMVDYERLQLQLEADKGKLTESLEQQTATSEILRVISSSPTDLQPVFDAILQSAARLCGGTMGALYRYDGQLLDIAATRGVTPEGWAVLRQIHPAAPTRTHAAGRAVLDGMLIHIPDVTLDPEYRYEPQAVAGHRSIVSVPMMREGKAIGAINVLRDEPRAFSERELELLGTFADQAVIAIENTRLFNETNEALEQQTATSEVLRVISSSPGDLDPIFRLLLEKAASLANADGGSLWVKDTGGYLRCVATHGLSPEYAEWTINNPTKLGKTLYRAEGPWHTLHLVDLRQTTDYMEGDLVIRKSCDEEGVRSWVAAPLLAEGGFWGTFSLIRREVREFNEKEIATLESFADQAMIAIQNARLFNETQEALERQTATAKILKVISSSPTDVQPVFEAIVGTAVSLIACDKAFLLRCDGNTFTTAAGANRDGSVEDIARPPVPVDPEANFPSRVIVDKAVLHLPNWSAIELPGYERDIHESGGVDASLMLPLLRDNACIGVLALLRAQAGAFSEKEIALAESFRDQAAIAVENTRMFNELESRNRDLTESLEQQTATSEILRVISQSQTDVQPVFETICSNAKRLCHATWAVFYTFDGELLSYEATDGMDFAATEATREKFPMPPDRGSALGRAIMTRSIAYIKDVLEDEEYGLESLADTIGYRSTISVPVLRGDVPIGAISASGIQPAMFSDRHIALLKTFADQAAIAIDNTRLFNELREQLEQQTVTSDILRVISNSPTDIRPVLDAISHSAARLCESNDAQILLVADDTLREASQYGTEMADGVGTILPLSRDLAIGCSVIEGKTIHVPDALALPEGMFVTTKRNAAEVGFRCVLAVPLLREGSLLGGIAVRREEPRPFSERQIALLKTFADQAVIAIENTRLFNETKEALERQTATADVLQVISKSVADAQPVFEKITQSCQRLFNGAVVGINVLRPDGLVDLAAFVGAGEAEFRTLYPVRLDESGTGLVIRERRAMHFPDALAGDDVPPGVRQGAELMGARSAVFAPLVWEDRAIGAIFVARNTVSPFSDREISLLKTFADQAAIAIQNARLFNETKEALERQTATSQVLQVISRSTFDLGPVFDTLVKNAARLCGAKIGMIFQRKGGAMHVAAWEGASENFVEYIRAHPIALDPGTATGRAALEGRTVEILDAMNDTEYRFAGKSIENYRTIIAVPLMREGQAIGSFTLWRHHVEAFTPRQIALVETFADQAVIAIENVRLFNETREALEQQTATSEVLKVISGSMADAAPVHEKILESCERLFTGSEQGIILIDNENALMRIGAHRGPAEGGLARIFPVKLTDTEVYNSIREHRVLRYDDVLEGVDVPESVRMVAHRLDIGNYSQVFAPMQWEGRGIGSLYIIRVPPVAFSDKEVALLETFADQAVIAIENARLFNELASRTKELGRSVEELKALGEVGNAVSSTLDLDTVLTTILAHANQLAGTQAGQVSDYDEENEELRARATLGYTQDIDEALRRDPIRKGEGVTGKAILTRQPVQVPDIAAEHAYDSRLRGLLMDSGFRALLSVPMIRENHVMGALTIARTQPGEFPQQVVDLLATFASQSALAMQNARLFHQLEIASQHKSTFLANMSHELRTPLNAIIGYSEMLQEDAMDEGAEGLVPDLKRVNSAGKHLLELINSILDLSKIEAGKMELQLEDFEVSDMVEDIRDVIQPLAEKNGSRLEVECSDEVGAMHADLTKVRQVLFNLLSNACKFTENGTVSLTVNRELVAGDSWLIFVVSDTGIGLTPEQLGRLFQEFSQADAETTRKYGGTGLGLALSRRLARLMGGEITAASDAGHGSVFTARLPANVAQIVERSEAEGAGVAGTVLVIDDEAAVRDLMRRFLGKEGFRVLTAAGGEEGLRIAAEQRPDAITLDVMMPGMDGWTVLSALMADPDLRDIPVIMLTIVDDKRTGYALGASDYLSKPIDRNRLLKVLTRYRRDLPILVVDDDAGVRQVLRRTLESEGYTVIEADNGRAALALLDKALPGVILLDLMMPELDGFGVVSALRRREAWRDIPVVIITAKELTNEERTWLNGSVVRILEKNAPDREALLSEVRDLVAASIGAHRRENG